MKVRSAVIPTRYQIWDEGNNARIKLRKNIERFEIEHDGKSGTEIQYDEVEVIIANRHNLKEYIEKNFDALFDMGIDKEKEPLPLSEIDQLKADIQRIASKAKIDLSS